MMGMYRETSIFRNMGGKKQKEIYTDRPPPPIQSAQRVMLHPPPPYFAVTLSLLLSLPLSLSEKNGSKVSRQWFRLAP